MSGVVVYGLGGHDDSLPNSNIVEAYETPQTGPPPLDPVGALATLLAVTEAVSVQDAANAVGLDPQALIDEAEAWAEFELEDQA
jgi:hypothetical protein